MLISGILRKRYKRFLAEIEILDEHNKPVIVTAHCPNSGSMRDVAQAGDKVWIAPNHSPTAKLDWQWQLVENLSGCLIGINTNRANNIVHEALLDQKIFSDYTNIKREVPYGHNSRVDFLLTDPNLPDYYLEVKSVNMVRQFALAEFPDAVTKRGQKHMYELSDMVEQGKCAGVIFLVQRNDCTSFQVAKDIDPDYYKSVLYAVNKGVQFFVYSTIITKTNCITLDKMLKLRL